MQLWTRNRGRRPISVQCFFPSANQKREPKEVPKPLSVISLFMKLKALFLETEGQLRSTYKIWNVASERPNLGSAEPLYLTYSVRVRGSGSVKVVAELFGKKFGSFFLGPRRELHMKY